MDYNQLITSLQTGSWRGQKKKLGKCKTEEFREQCNWGGAGKPVDFVFNVPIGLW